MNIDKKCAAVHEEGRDPRGQVITTVTTLKEVMKPRLQVAGPVHWTGNPYQYVYVLEPCPNPNGYPGHPEAFSRDQVENDPQLLAALAELAGFGQDIVGFLASLETLDIAAQTRLQIVSILHLKIVNYQRLEVE